jgi:pyruvoyl-dependent arginine decarboxylase (PvlArgDC)
MARSSTSSGGETIAAGIGWVMEKNRHFGLFVEHDGRSREEVVGLIETSLRDMTAGRAEYEFSPIKFCVEETVCEKGAACVLAAAVYRMDNWV